ncbi:hypothetical protein BHM03_00051653 [Ensete ventricosum]|uniref:Uncharacterized protein n=1 Tax=Ensete ventricosum TaxID=4639 RepID=A0A445MLT4_ENSVE|nr:hypothetical protein BHM03_00051653 [Ensete ventricosum]
MGVGGAGEGGGEDERAGTGGREVRVLALKVDDGEAWCREQPSSVSALTEEEKESSARLQKEVKLSLYSENPYSLPASVLKSSTHSLRASKPDHDTSLQCSTTQQKPQKKRHRGEPQHHHPSLLRSSQPRKAPSTVHLRVRYDLAAIPVLSFSEERVGEVSLDLKSTPLETAHAVVHRGLVTEQQNQRRDTASILTTADLSYSTALQGTPIRSQSLFFSSLRSCSRIFVSLRCYDEHCLHCIQSHARLQ